MPSSRLEATSPKSTHERFDVVIVGAGISGIGCAYLLRQHCPELSFVILDAMESHGGTWLIHKYPGARSDSDLFTFGYRFKPWTGAPIATAAPRTTSRAVPATMPIRTGPDGRPWPPLPPP